MTRLFSDMNAAYKQMLRNPVRFTDAIAGAVGKAERGAHRQKHLAIAMSVGIAREVCKNFARFEELRGAACLRDNAKVQKATEKNFKKFVPIAVATRSFNDTDANENRISVYSYGIGYFVDKDIDVSDIADKIKAMKGIDGVYKRIKAKKLEARDEFESDNSDNTESADPKQDKRKLVAPQSMNASEEREYPARTSSRVSSEPLTVEWILDNFLLLATPKGGELERYRDGSARLGQRRTLQTVYGGCGAHGLHIWEYVYGHDVNADHSGRKDNDNTEDYEDEDEEAA